MTNRLNASFPAAVATALVFALCARDVLATPYFKCASGYTFHVNNAGTGAHCKKMVNDLVKPISCPNVTIPGVGSSVGTFPFVKPGKDICRGQVKVAGVTQTTDHAPLACPTGYSYKKNYQGTKDRCVKSGGWVYKAPTVQFN